MPTIQSTKHMIEIGLRIKELREKKFDKSLTAAKKWGVTPQTWSAYESGKLKFTAEKLVELSEFLDCDAGWLLTGHTTPKPAPVSAGNRPSQSAPFVRMISLLVEYDSLARSASREHIAAWNHVCKTQSAELERSIESLIAEQKIAETA